MRKQYKELLILKKRNHMQRFAVLRIYDFCIVLKHCTSPPHPVHCGFPSALQQCLRFFLAVHLWSHSLLPLPVLCKCLMMQAHWPSASQTLKESRGEGGRQQHDWKDHTIAWGKWSILVLTPYNDCPLGEAQGTCRPFCRPRSCKASQGS